VDIVLGVSMTPTKVRMVLVEGERADGSTIDHDVFDVAAADDLANPGPSDQVISAILGTQQSAVAGGHRLLATGVTWTDHDEAAMLRDALAAHGIEDVMLVSELHAAGALAQAVGRAVGYDKTALMLIDRDTATLSVVETLDGSIVKVLTRSLHSADAMAVLADMVTSVEAQEVRPEALFVVGSGVDVTSVKEHLEHLVSIPVSAPEDSEMALTRGAAIAAASAPRFEASTVGLAYSQDPYEPVVADPSAIDPWAPTQLRMAAASAPAALDDVAVADVDDVDEATVHDETRRPFLLVGSTLTGVFIIGVVALVITLAASIRPTADTRPNAANPGENVVVPTAPAPAAPASPPQAQAAPPAPIAAPAPPPETIKAPIPVVKAVPQAPPRQVVAAPAPQAPPPAPEVLPPVPAAPVPVPDAPIPAPLPVIAPPIFYPPVIGPVFPRPPVFRPPWYPPRQPQQPPWYPPQQPPWTPPQQPPPTVPQQPPWTPPQQEPQYTPPQQQNRWDPPEQQSPQWTPPQQQSPQWTPPQQQVPQQQAPQWSPPQQQSPQWSPPQQQMPQRPSGPSRGGPHICIGRGSCY
jgi:hypothetical protein